MVMICCVCKVEEVSINSHLVFHHLPKNPDRRKQWLEVLKKGNVKDLVVCSKHFKPDDYREFCDRPLLNKNAIPRLSELNTCTQSTEKDPINVQDSTIEMDCHEKTIESASIDNMNDSRNIVIVEVKPEHEHEPERLTECPLETIDKTRKNCKRRNNIDCNGSSALSKKRCYLKNFGIFRKEDFKTEESWNRFLAAFEDMRKDKLLLQRKNERLFTKVQKFKGVIKDLKRKKLATDSVIDILNVSLKSD
ncbi:PREDICTED: uncharacterized protein LOC105561459 [Vollenhovia emeryi]|uniref:uncharacterized protein LOC105561459 n=1 Tax=Vollenhovia emeryi TaxID=411798 RepID=UPI0005F52CA0|nr:PREDICTED: uncharacterized protein LOC105561459 [Vollenhovia emeryi]